MFRFLLALIGLVLATTVACEAAPQREWKLVMHEEFNDDSTPVVNASTFELQTGFSYGTGELAYYTTRPENVYKANGSLRFKAIHEPYTYPGGTSEYTSGSIQSVDSFTYGRFEARIKMPKGRGTWPAFWMLGADIATIPWPYCGEIDIVENVGYDPLRAHGTLHDEENNSMKNNDITNAVTIPNMYDDFVVYAAEWTPEGITITAANKTVLDYRNPMECSDQTWPYHRGFNIKLNYAVGGAWGGKHGVDNSIFPNEMMIDYVRVYQPVEPFTIPACRRWPYYLVLETDILQRQETIDTIFSDGNGIKKAMELASSELAQVFGFRPHAVNVAQISPLPRTGNTTALLINYTVVNIMPTNATFQNAMEALSRENKPKSWFELTLNQMDNLAAHAHIVDPPKWSIASMSGHIPRTPTLGAPAIPFSQNRVLPVSFSAVDYDFGGQDVGYFDTTTWNLYGNYGRSGPDGVDVSPMSSEHSELAVGYMVTGEFLQYSNLTVLQSSSVPFSKQYALKFTYANGMEEGQVRVAVDGVDTGTVWLLPPTGGWETFTNSSEGFTLWLYPGQHSIRLTFPVPNYRISQLHFVEVVTASSSTVQLPFNLNMRDLIGIGIGVGCFLLILAVFLVTKCRSKPSSPKEATRLLPQ